MVNAEYHCSHRHIGYHDFRGFARLVLINGQRKEQMMGQKLAATKVENVTQENGESKF